MGSVVSDVLKVAVVVVSIVFHRTLKISGTDETFIITILSTVLSTKWGVALVNAIRRDGF